MIHIEMIVENVAAPELTFILPDWRPGRYELASYVANIKSIHFNDSNEVELNAHKIKTNQWVIETNKEKSVKVNYTYYAYKMDAGSSVVDDEQIYINFINCLLYAPGRQKEQTEVIVDIPDGFKSTCALIQNDNSVYVASDYFELVDSPFLASDSLKQLTYYSYEKEFNVYIQGDCPLDEGEVIAEFKKFTDYQIKQMRGFPTERYDFLIQSLPYMHYHGVEHKNSTVLVLGPSDRSNKEKYREDLLGVASHELFHTWNVTRIRPVEMSPYNFSMENYYETGFVTEGFTTYYGDLLLARSGVFSDEDYLKELNTLFKRHFENYGRHNLSLVDSSFDLWIDGYKKLLPGRKVSIYVKGAITSLMLDLSIRKKTLNESSLDDVVMDLWEGFGKISKGYSKEDVYHIVRKYLKDEADHFIQEYYEGITPVEDELTKLLDYIGCKLVVESHPETLASLYGVRIEAKGERNLITEIVLDSAAEEYLSVGDEIMNLDEIKGAASENVSDSEFKLIRNTKQTRITLTPTEERFFGLYRIEKNDMASEQAQSNYTVWISGNH
ncbi:MAG: M61 family metallopeptidase [Cyclobacteriaceae bacterium]